MDENQDKKCARPKLPLFVACRRMLVTACVAVWIVIVCLAFLWRMFFPPVAPYLTDRPLELVRDHLQWIRHELEYNAAAERRQRAFPEGYLFCNSFHAFTLINLAMDYPDDSRLRADVIAQLKALLERTRWDKHTGIIHMGHLNLVRAGFLCLADDDDIEDAFKEDCALLTAAYERTDCASLPSYGNLTWPVDNLAALNALCLHDELFGTDYRKYLDRWIAWMSAHRDRETGLMISQWDRVEKAPLDVPRGCALSWDIAFLGVFAPDFGASEYARYKELMGLEKGTLKGFREWPPGYSRPADVDSGPVIDDIGVAASAFGLAAAKIMRDREYFKGLLGMGEAIGLPTTDGRGRRYFAGHFLLADVLATWAKTHRRWEVIK